MALKQQLEQKAGDSSEDDSDTEVVDWQQMGISPRRASIGKGYTAAVLTGGKSG